MEVYLPFDPSCKSDRLVGLSGYPKRGEAGAYIDTGENPKDIWPTYVGHNHLLGFHLRLFSRAIKVSAQVRPGILLSVTDGWINYFYCLISNHTVMLSINVIIFSNYMICEVY